MECHVNAGISNDDITMIHKAMKHITKLRFLDVNIVARARGSVDAENGKDAH